MPPISMKTSFLAFTLVAIITGCTTASQNQVQPGNNPAATNNGNNQHTAHSSNMAHTGSMNHDMAMDLGPADANYDLRFIDAMTLHHQGAVSMAKEAQQKSKRAEIKKLANEIIAAQNKEINQLKQWRKGWYPQASNKSMMYDASQGKMMPMSSEQMKSMMMDKNLGSADAEFDLRFIDAMIPHHEGAIDMAEDARNKSKQSEIKKLSQNVISSQKSEIEQMKKWRQAWYKN